MNKVVFVLSCVTASSFLCAMEPNIIKLSPRKSSGSSLQPVTKGKRLTDTDPVQESPIYSRVRSQSRESKGFLAEENITSRTLQRTNSADKK